MFVAAHIPLPIFLVLSLLSANFTSWYVFIGLSLDQYGALPIKLIIIIFLYGAIVVTTGAFFLPPLIDSFFDKFQLNIPIATVIGPIIEEILKIFPLVVLFKFRKQYFYTFSDIIVLSICVSLGFAMFENILYYAHGLGEFLPTLKIVFNRSIIFPYLHPLFTLASATGLYFYLRYKKSAILCILLLGLLLHCLWNYMIMSSLNFWTIFGAIFVPIMLACSLLFVYDLILQKRIIFAQMRKMGFSKDLINNIASIKQKYKNVLNSSSIRVAIEKIRLLGEITSDILRVNRGKEISILNLRRKVQRYRKGFDHE
jgi:RsiW-degrading membrane proteinase PrsW (M82 family)